LGLRTDVTNLPIAQLGCSGALASLGIADDVLRSRPAGSALVVAIELPSTMFRISDASMAGIVTASLFGDGAAAVACAGVAAKGIGERGRITVTAHQSIRLPGTTDLMGMKIRTDGFETILSPSLPDAIRTGMPSLVDGFLRKEGLSAREIDHILVHPGGPKIL